MVAKKEKEQLTLEGTEEAEILTRLSERVDRAVQTIQELRKERDDLRGKLDKAEQQLKTQQSSAEGLAAMQVESEKSRAQRGEIKRRIERVLETLERLDEMSNTD